MVDALDLGSSTFRCGGSNPLMGNQISNLLKARGPKVVEKVP